MKTTDKINSESSEKQANLTSLPTLKVGATLRSIRPQKSMMRIKSLKPKRLAVISDLKKSLKH